MMPEMVLRYVSLAVLLGLTLLRSDGGAPAGESGWADRADANYVVRFEMPSASPASAEEIVELTLSDPYVPPASEARETQRLNVPSRRESVASAFAAPPPQEEIAGVLPVDFDLAQPKQTGAKTRITYRGKTKETPIKVTNGGEVLVAPEELAEIVGKEKTAELGEDAVTFDKLRDAGYAVRYDPVGDQVTITDPS